MSLTFQFPSSSSCSWRVRSVILFLNPQDEVGPSTSYLVVPLFLRPFGLYCNACFGSLFVSTLCMCSSHFFWYCFISFTILCAPVFSLIQWFFSLSNFVIPSKCLKNFICAASKCCSSLFFSTQMWILQEPKKIALWNKPHLEKTKRGMWSMFKIFSKYICWVNV